MPPLEERLNAYLQIINGNPSLDIHERQTLFSLALWPTEEELSWEHFQACTDKHCPLCEAGVLPQAA